MREERGERIRFIRRQGKGLVRNPLQGGGILWRPKKKLVQFRIIKKEDDDAVSEGAAAKEGKREKAYAQSQAGDGKTIRRKRKQQLKGRG